jgi:hypothetical protein
VILADESEPQPDLLLRVLSEYGGQTQVSDDDYIQGAPELVAEIAHSSRAIDLHSKRIDYARNGVREYLVVCLAERQLRWFDLRADTELAADGDGVLRIRAFPGLWIHADALLNKEFDRLMATLQQGLDAPEHAEFIHRLAAAHQTRPQQSS